MTSPSRKPRSVVSNSSPLIHLARIGRLELLQKLFQEVVIPLAVYREVVVEGRGKPGADLVQSAPWIRVKQLRDQALKQSLTLVLDEGEAEAIALAVEEHAELVLLDEREACVIAKRLGLKVTGTLGVIVKARKLNLVKNVREELDKLKATGFRIAPELEELILRAAGEEADRLPGS